MFISKTAVMNELSKYKRLLLFTSCGFLLAVYWATFVYPFMPTAAGTLGHDHQGSLVEATIGYVHFQKSPLTLPWFTPTSCAGNMYIAGAANPYLNLQQWLTFAFNPLTASKINFMVFATLGLLGTYLLCRRKFHADPISSLLGASLFLFNGFYAYRMIIGHTAFHSFMLIPLIGFLLISESPTRTEKQARNILIAALLLSYLILASGVYVLFTAGLALLGILSLHSMRSGNPASRGQNILAPYLPLVAALAVAMLLCLFKITLILSTSANFERDFYPLPGIDSVVDSLTLPIRLLFFSAPDWETEGGFLFTNYRWSIERHELEMGVGLPALILLVLFAVTARKKIAAIFNENRFAALLLVFILLVPIVLNFYQPLWNELLKSIPVLRSFSLYVRLYAVYIPLIVIAVVLAFSRVPRHRLPLALAITCMTVASHWLTDRSYYAEQNYKPDVLVEFYDRYRHHPDKIPPVSTTSQLSYANFQDETIFVQNEMFIFGSSNIQCHNDMFGYRLEVFPKRELLEPNASVFKETNGQLNFKNPSCYVFPDANQCEPGDHFTADQTQVLDEFVQYLGLEFNMPRYQWMSNSLSFFSLVLVITAIIMLSLRERWRP